MGFAGHWEKKYLESCRTAAGRAHFAGATGRFVGVPGTAVPALAALSLAFSFSRFSRYEDLGRPGMTVFNTPKYQRPKMAPSKMMSVMIRLRAEWESANGSNRSVCALGGSLATLVSDAPKGMLILARAFTAQPLADRKSTRLNSSHSQISYAVFCLKKKKKNTVNQAAHELTL